MVKIQNIFYILCYNWDQLTIGNQVKAGIEKETTLLDLLARLYINAVIALQKKGLDKDYILQEETIPSILGKLNISDSIKTLSLYNCKMHCGFDSFDFDIPQNQIIRTTLSRLIRAKELDKGLKKSLRTAFYLFPKVKLLEQPSEHYDRVKYNRNNTSYKFILNLSKLINNFLLPDKSGDGYYFKDFSTESDREMGLLFEGFVRNFFKTHLTSGKVSREKIDWNLVSQREEDMAFLPTLYTDISILFPNKKVIIETKYTKSPLAEQFGKLQIRSDHLRQLFAYLKNAETKGGLDEKCEGILLYARADRDIDREYHEQSHLMRVKTIDLNQDWECIHNSLINLLNPDSSSTSK